MKRKEIDDCAIQSWYEKFEQVTIPTVIIPLEEEFISYLLADSIFIPGNEFSHESDDESESNDGGDNKFDKEDKDNESNEKQYSFPLLDAKIKNAIQHFNGECFPKLNWSSPRDATWIAFGNSLSCKTPADIYLLLKSSDFISHDLKHAYDQCQEEKIGKPQFFLALKEWMGNLINPALEFRCFVKDQQIIGICQRDDRNFYPSIVSTKDSIFDAIHDFFESHVQNVFPSSDYTFDVYCTAKFKVRIIDFNPFSSTTDSILFDWNELLESKTSLGFRVIESNESARGTQPAFSHNRLPREAFDFSRDGAGIAEFAERFNQELVASLES